MNLSLLEKKLNEANISTDAYSLKCGLPNEKYCIGHENMEWITYYSERGLRTRLTRHASEAEACQSFLDQLIHDSSTRNRNL